MPGAGELETKDIPKTDGFEAGEMITVPKMVGKVELLPSSNKAGLHPRVACWVLACARNRAIVCGCCPG